MLKAFKRWWKNIEFAAGFDLSDNGTQFRARAGYHQYCMDQSQNAPCRLPQWRRRIIYWRMECVTRVVVALHIVKPFVYTENIWHWFKHLCLSQICKVRDHDWVDESYGGPDSGCMAGTCRRCGYSFHHKLY